MINNGAILEFFGGVPQDRADAIITTNSVQINGGTVEINSGKNWMEAK